MSSSLTVYSKTRSQSNPCHSIKHKWDHVMPHSMQRPPFHWTVTYTVWLVPFLTIVSDFSSRRSLYSGHMDLLAFHWTMSGMVSLRTLELTVPSAWNVLPPNKHTAYKGYITTGKYKCFITYKVINKYKILYYQYFNAKCLLALYLISLEWIWFTYTLESNWNSTCHIQL